MPLVDRLLRGRAWVAIVGVLLAGIVFLNVSLLELNRGIAKSDAQAAALERTNSSLRERVAKLDSGERIQQLAAASGFVMPQPGDVNYVRARASDAKFAAERITPPFPTTAALTATGATGVSSAAGTTTGATGTTTATGTTFGTGTGTGTSTSTGTSSTTSSTGSVTQPPATYAQPATATSASTTTQAP
jgi:cell division protein FtsB